MIHTRLTERIGLTHPIVQAPMAFAAGGRLAAAVSSAGGLGLIGGGYGDAEWLDAQFAAAGDVPVGCGFITWALAERPALLDAVLAREPQAICLSFGDPAPFARRILDAGVLLIVQVQTLRDAQRAIDAGADLVVAQGSEAGGHGERRATMTLLPEVADLIARTSPDTLLCAAGGIADGRGLAASLMLGADGVLVGSRLWASEEAIVPEPMLSAACDADGDATLRTDVLDVVRQRDWPGRYTARVLANEFTDRWHGDADGLRAAGEPARDAWAAAWAAGDAAGSATFVGEATGLIDRVAPVAELLEDMVATALDRLERPWRGPRPGSAAR